MSNSSEIRRKLAQDDFRLNIEQGNVPKHRLQYIYGLREDINSVDPASDLWTDGGEYPGHPSQAAPAETVSIVSDDVDDTAGGDGANAIRITGLDSSWNEVTETIVLNGTTPVVSGNTYHRVYEGIVLTAGSSGGNEGTISCNHTTTTANIFFKMRPGLSWTTECVYTVPDSKILRLDFLRFHLIRTNGSAGSAVVTARVRVPGSVFQAVRYDLLSDSAPLVDEGYYSIPARTDIKLRAESVTDNNTTISGALHGILVDI